MEHARFDTLAKLMAAPGSRRRLLGGVFAGALGLSRSDAEAAFVCRPIGRSCREDVNCCTEYCATDATRRRRCACPPDSKVCGDSCIPVAGCCTDADCEPGRCIDNTCVFSCFVAGTRIAMADGTSRPIEAIAVGDRVLGRHGQSNRVVAVERPVLGARMLYAFNDGRFFVTAEHPFLTEEGWKSVDPVATDAENPALRVGRLTAGDRLLTLAGVTARVAVGGAGSEAETEVRLAAVPLNGLVGRTADPRTPLYNVLLDGDHAYFADDWLVHNKG